MTEEVDICNGALRHLGTRKLTGTTVALLSGANKEERACAYWYPKVRDELLRAHPWRFAGARSALAPRDITGDGGASYSITAAEAAVGVRLSLVEIASGSETEWTDGVEYTLTSTTIDTSAGTDAYGNVSTSYYIRVRLIAPLGGEWAYQHFIPSGCLRLRRVVVSGYRHHYAREGDRILSEVDEAVCVYTNQITDPDEFDGLFINALEARLAARMANEITGSQSMVESLMRMGELYEVQARSVGAMEADGDEAHETEADVSWLTAIQ